MRNIILFSMVIILSCKANSKVNQTSVEKESDFIPVYSPGPHALVYKTKGNYRNLVPVLLSDDKTEIVSYPHPSDIKNNSGYPLPTLLKKDYLLDNRGIGKNVAFLKLSYEEYAKLESAPSLKELYNLIIDKDPLTELCDCGNKKAFTNIEEQLNNLIEKNILQTTCKMEK